MNTTSAASTPSSASTPSEENTQEILPDQPEEENTSTAVECNPEDSTKKRKSPSDTSDVTNSIWADSHGLPRALRSQITDCANYIAEQNKK